MINVGWDTGERMRVHGTNGATVIVLHGGPAAAGSAAPIARGLADSFHVLEPWQRGSGDEPLTVKRHVEDLHDLISARCSDGPPALVGWSWGAMLALAYSAAHPEQAGPIALVGCGTFDRQARARMHAILADRKDAELQGRITALEKSIPDPEERLVATYELIETLYTYEATDDEQEQEPEDFDVRAHEETWEDMIRQQDVGLYPAAFARIRSSVLMLHGTYDPHPGDMIRASLEPLLPQLEYHPLERCGHSPWQEVHAREAFFEVLTDWLTRHHPGPVS